MTFPGVLHTNDYQCIFYARLLGTGGKLESKTIILNLFDQRLFARQRVAKSSAATVTVRFGGHIPLYHSIRYGNIRTAIL